MLALLLTLGGICMLAASYLTSLGIVYFINRFAFKLPFDMLAYIECPLSAQCVEYGSEYRMWIWAGTLIIFLICGVAAPLIYYKKVS